MGGAALTAAVAYPGKTTRIFDKRFLSTNNNNNNKNLFPLPWWNISFCFCLMSSHAKRILGTKAEHGMDVSFNSLLRVTARPFSSVLFSGKDSLTTTVPNFLSTLSLEFLLLLVVVVLFFV